MKRRYLTNEEAERLPTGTIFRFYKDSIAEAPRFKFKDDILWVDHGDGMGWIHLWSRHEWIDAWLWIKESTPRIKPFGDYHAKENRSRS